MRIAFFAARPISMTKPISEKTSICMPRSHSAAIAPRRASGTARMTMKGIDQLSYCAAIAALWLRGMQIDVFSEIGLVMLIGLAAKSAILIVEFAKHLREEGHGIIEAAMEAGRLRIRPILMTAFAFILGVAPLMVASGAGAASRQSIGTTVLGGMLVATLLSLACVPVFYAVIERLREGRSSAQISLARNGSVQAD